MILQALLPVLLLAAAPVVASPRPPEHFPEKEEVLVKPDLELPQTVTVIDGETITIAPKHQATRRVELRPHEALAAPQAHATASPTEADLKKVKAKAVAQAKGRNKAKRAATPTTLASGEYWIRAVESPNFHKYLQTNPVNEPGTAILGSYTTAGQFNIVDGQLVEDTFGGDPLYMHVEQPANLTAGGTVQRTLKTWFNTTMNTFGTFAFQGDAVTWNTTAFTRGNLAAWLVCANQALYINTGAYDYQTPSGCADETIHYYNGATAVD